jgi:short-subunit dehydrogenase
MLAGMKQRILITGASRGIGRETALVLARRGARVVLAARNEDELREVAAAVDAAGGAPELLPLDVTEDDSVEQAIARALRAGPIDALINNAGVFGQCAFLEQDPAWRRREMEVNYFGALRVARAVLPSMIRRGSGTILNVTSLVGAIPCPSVANYSASKAALEAWSHALRGELSRFGVRVVVFMPSHTATAHATASTTFEGVPALPVDYTARQLVHALDRTPRRFAASPVFRMFLRLAGMFPAWAERQMAASTRKLLLAQQPALPHPTGGMLQP